MLSIINSVKWFLMTDDVTLEWVHVYLIAIRRIHSTLMLITQRM